MIFQACGKKSDECTVGLDDGFLNGDMVHDGGSIPGDGWKYDPKKKPPFDDQVMRDHRRQVPMTTWPTNPPWEEESPGVRQRRKAAEDRMREERRRSRR